MCVYFSLNLQLGKLVQECSAIVVWRAGIGVLHVDEAADINRYTYELTRRGIRY